MIPQIPGNSGDWISTKKSVVYCITITSDHILLISYILYLHSQIIETSCTHIVIMQQENLDTTELQKRQ